MPTLQYSWPARRLAALAGISILALGAGAAGPALKTVERHVVRGGSVAMFDLTGRVTLEPVAGSDVVVEVTRGGADGARLRVVGDSPVRVTLLSGQRHNLHIDAGSGGVTLAVPRGLDASFDIGTGRGGLHIGVPHRVMARDPDHVRGRFGEGRGRITIESGSGGVRIVPHETSSPRSPGGVGALIRYGFA